MPKRLLHIPKGLFKLAIFLVILGVAAALALVRTQAGRDVLRNQIEAEFGKAFEGSLEIGRLYGNITRTFQATDVFIQDPDGRTVLQVDSLIVQLGLLDGFRRNITIRHAVFIRPRVSLFRNDSTGWNLPRAISLRERTGSSSTKWAFRSADVAVVNGSVVTHNGGSRPASVDSLQIFDFTNARLDDFHASATIDWSEEGRLIDLRNLHAFLSDQGVEISSLRSQISVTDSSVAINGTELTTPSSHLSASLNLSGLDSLSALFQPKPTVQTVALTIDGDRIDSTEVAALFPSLRLPDAELHVKTSGSSSNLHVDNLSLRLGGSTVDGIAAFVGWPDSVSYSVEIDDAILRPEEMALFVPSFGETLRQLPSQEMRIQSSGALRQDGARRLTRFRSQTSFEINSEMGLANGEVEFSRLEDDTLRYSGQVLLDGYDADLLAAAFGRTRLNGTLDFGGFGATMPDLIGTAELGLRESIVRGTAFDTLHVEARSVQNLISVMLQGNGPDGGVNVVAGADLREGVPQLEARIQLRDFNAMALASGIRRQGASAISTEIGIRTRGDSLDNLAANVTVAIDTATFFVGRDTMTLSESRHRLSVEHADSAHTNLALSGDVLEGNVTGRFTFGPLIRTGGLWWGAAMHTLAEQTNKRLHSDDLLTVEDVQEEAFTFERGQLRGILLDHGYSEGLEFEGHLRVKRLLDLHQLAAIIPPAARSASINASGHLSADSLAMTIRFDADSVRGEGLSVDGLTLRADVSGPFQYSLESELASTIDLEVDALGFGTQRLEDLDVNYRFADRKGQLAVSSSDTAEGGLSLAMDASLDIMPEWSEVHLADLTVRKNAYIWSTHNEANFRLFGDAVDVGNLAIRSLHNLTGFDHPDQVLSFDGIVSSDPSDTLVVNAGFVRLEEISDLGQFKFAIGGQMHAALTVAHALREPRAAGDLSVDALTFDGRDVGNLHVESVYSSPTEGIGVDIRLTQPREKLAGIQRYDAHIYGTVRPPTSDPGDHGSLNLLADLKEIDLFFFEYLFPNELADVSGEGSGLGTVTGDFQSPQFDASLQLDRSSFLVPEFNLRFGLSGPVTVDRFGFHLDNVSLTDPTGGLGSLRGDILFNEYKFFSFDIAADLSEIMIMNVSRSMDLSFYGQVWVSGSATLTGPLQQTLLRSADAVTAQKSRLYLPVTEDEIESDKTFIVFADSTGEFQVEQRGNILSKRPQTERAFIEGMDMNFNILIPEESSVFLVFDPLLGDVINALGSGRVQMQRREGDFSAFGTFTVDSGDYLFTAGEVFQRRFILQNGGTITWDGDPIDARFDIPAVYRTRASLSGLPGQNPEDRVPIRVDMALTGRVTTPIVDLRIALDLDQRDPQVIPPGLESALNQADLATEYATSVLLTNTFLLTSNQGSDALTNTADDLLFHSLSQLVSSQLNRFVSQTLNLDVNLGVQQGRTEEEYDVIYGFALRLDDQRVVIRGEGLYETGTNETSSASGLQGAFVVEYRLTPAVQLEFFFRRESDLYRAASSLGTAYGVGIVYQTDFPNWVSFGRKLRGRKEPDVEPAPPAEAVPASD